MADKIKFLHKEYSKEDLEKMQDPELLELRNLVAGNMSTAKIKGFKDHDAAVKGTWDILQKYDAADEPEKAGDAEKAAKEKKAKEPRPTPKCYSAQTVKRPTRRMFERIKKHGAPDKSQRPFVWDEYKDGERLIDIMEDEKRHAGKITFWARQDPPLITFEKISDEQFNKELDEWYAKHGRTNPEKAKREAKEKREADKAAKAKEREEAKAAKEKEKAAKAEAKAKADKEKAEAKAQKAAAAEAANKTAPKEAKAEGKKAPAAS